MTDPLQAFEQFYRREYPRLAGSLRLVCGDETLSEEIAQEAFARALTHWDRLEHYESPAGWLYRVAFNLLRKQWKKAAQEIRLPATNTNDNESAGVERVDLVRALSTLPVRQREVVVLRHIAGYSTEQVAELVDMKEGAVRMALHRAIASLRSHSGLMVEVAEDL